jgi:transposase
MAGSFSASLLAAGNDRRGDLTDKAWEQIVALLPRNGRRGQQWKDHRKVISGILWRLRTGAPWCDLPPRYGPWQTCYERFVRWRRDGTWDRLLANAQTKSDAVGEVEWEVSVDSTIARAHQHAAGARREPSRVDAKRGSFIRRMRQSDAVGEDRRARYTSAVMGRGGRSRSS